MNQTICKLCNKKVTQDLWVWEVSEITFNYGCGCISNHFEDRVIWTSKEGKTVEIDICAKT